MNWKLPPSLLHAGPLRRSFDHARDPYISTQIKDLEKSEAQRREETGRGSMMVKLHKPFPELRPKNETKPLRQAFNSAWLKEQREAMMSRFESEQKHQEKNTDYVRSEPNITRGYER